jgi:hypothetical protein
MRTAEQVIHDCLREWSIEQFIELEWNNRAAAEIMKALNEVGYIVSVSPASMFSVERAAATQTPMITLDDIVNEIIKLLRARDDLGGHFQQEPYKSDFFRLFETALEAGLFSDDVQRSLKHDRLVGIIAARAPDVLDGKIWPMLSTALLEWDYAISHRKRELSPGERQALASTERLN